MGREDKEEDAGWSTTQSTRWSTRPSAATPTRPSAAPPTRPSAPPRPTPPTPTSAPHRPCMSLCSSAPLVIPPSATTQDQREEQPGRKSRRKPGKQRCSVPSSSPTTLHPVKQVKKCGDLPPGSSTVTERRVPTGTTADLQPGPQQDLQPGGCQQTSQAG